LVLLVFQGGLGRIGQKPSKTPSKTIIKPDPSRRKMADCVKVEKNLKKYINTKKMSPLEKIF
jgi:hypothetical protein